MCCSSLLAACGGDGPLVCNEAPVDIEVENASQYEILELRIDDGEDVLTEPLRVDESVVVTGFENAGVVAFRRARPDAVGEIVVRSAEPLCPSAGGRIILFDQSFRVTSE